MKKTVAIMATIGLLSFLGGSTAFGDMLLKKIPFYADLAVTIDRIDVPPPNQPGRATVLIKMTAHNQGIRPTPMNFLYVVTSEPGGGADTVVATFPLVKALNPGEKTSFVEVRAVRPGQFLNVFVSIDPLNTIVEINETNNSTSFFHFQVPPETTPNPPPN